jgi:hypothetical protein
MMPDLLVRVSAALDNLLSHHEAGPTIGFLPAGQCFPTGVAGYTISPNEMFFEVRAHQLYLARNQILWTTHDPLAVVAVEFNYGAERIILPRVVGPDLISSVIGPTGANGGALHGTVLTNTLIAGPHPYRGGDVDLTVRLFAVQRTNFARTLLRTAERLSTAIGDPGGLATFEKTGDAMVSSIEAMFGLTATRYLAGARLSTRIGNRPFRAGYVVATTPPMPSPADMAVDGDTLRDAHHQTAWTGSDFVLLGIHGTKVRGDESRLPFNTLCERALRAVADGESSWERAKGLLIAAYQDMLVSPDLTRPEAGRLFDEWMSVMRSERARMLEVRNFGQQLLLSRTSQADTLDKALRNLDRPI